MQNNFYASVSNLKKFTETKMIFLQAFEKPQGSKKKKIKKKKKPETLQCKQQNKASKLCVNQVISKTVSNHLRNFEKDRNKFFLFLG